MVPFPEPPSCPHNLQVVHTDRGEISIEWLPSKESFSCPVDRYIVEMATGDSGEFIEVGKVVGTMCHYEARDLVEGEKYNFRIKAENRAGTSSAAQLEKPVVASALGKSRRAA